MHHFCMTARKGERWGIKRNNIQGGRGLQEPKRERVTDGWGPTQGVKEGTKKENNDRKRNKE